MSNKFSFNPISGQFDETSTPITTLGDLIYGGAGGVDTRLPIGTTSQVLQVAGGIPTWVTVVPFSDLQTQVRYIDPVNGNNANNGSLSSPWLTLTFAEATITDATSSKVYVINLLPGTYTEGGAADVVIKPFIYLVGAVPAASVERVIGGGGIFNTATSFPSTTFTIAASSAADQFRVENITSAGITNTANAGDRKALYLLNCTFTGSALLPLKVQNVYAQSCRFTTLTMDAQGTGPSNRSILMLDDCFVSAGLSPDSGAIANSITFTTAKSSRLGALTLSSANQTMRLYDTTVESIVVTTGQPSVFSGINLVSEGGSPTTITGAINLQNLTGSRVLSVTATATLDARYNVVLVNATSGNITLTIPTSSDSVNYTPQITRTDATGNTVTIVAATGTIQGAASITLDYLNASVYLGHNPVSGTWAYLELTSPAVTLTAVGASPNANGGSITAAQVLTLQPANASFPGVLTAADWSTFNGKQAAGNYITALTGDATASGPGSVALTLATVNGNVGTFGSSTAIPTFTVNAKGLITAVSTNAVIAPAGTLTGTTLASNVVSSSLASVGTITSGVWNGTTIAIANGGTGQTTADAAFNALSPMTTGGDIIYGGASGVGTRLANGTSGQFLKSNGTTAAPSWANPAISLTAPTIQKFLSGSNTYTTPASVLYIRVRMVGGGGGGAGSNPTGNGGNGGTTTFGSSLLTALGGSGGSNSGGGGGVPTIAGGATGTAVIGGSGTGGWGTNAQSPGSPGGNSAYGGGGGGGLYTSAGSPAQVNSGSGGGGAGGGTLYLNGGGGGAGGFIDAIITAPSATYAYAVAAAGAAGSSANNGGAGGSGYIEVTEYYQ